MHKAIDWKRASSKICEDIRADLTTVQDASTKVNPDAMLLHHENRDKVRQVCQSLPEIYSKVIYQFYFQSRSYRDIASAEGISLKTVESRLYRARSMFREKWREEVGE